MTATRTPHSTDQWVSHSNSRGLIILTLIIRTLIIRTRRKPKYEGPGIAQRHMDGKNATYILLTVDVKLPGLNHRYKNYDGRSEYDDIRRTELVIITWSRRRTLIRTSPAELAALDVRGICIIDVSILLLWVGFNTFSHQRYSSGFYIYFSIMFVSSLVKVKFEGFGPPVPHPSQGPFKSG